MLRAAACALHVALFAAGLATGGSVPSWAVGVGWIFVILSLVWRLSEFYKEELKFLVGACRETLLCILAYYVDSVAVYMVAVMHDRRFDNIHLQDNFLLAIEYVCGRSKVAAKLIARLPELNADEVTILLAAGAFLLAPASGIPVLAVAQKLGRAMRYSRLLRVICYCSTVLPSPSPSCFVNRYDESYSVSEHWREAVRHLRSGGGCNDLIFSGHGTVLAFCALMHTELGAPLWLRLFLWGRVGHASIRIVQSQSHFSVDLVVAIILATLLWYVLELPKNDQEAFALPKMRARGALIMWSSALVASLGVLAALLTSSAAGPLSEANWSRLAEISAEPPAPSPAPRLFCAMMHIERSYQARRGYAEAAQSTWARRCDGFVLWDENVEAVATEDARSALEEPPVDFRPIPAGVAFRWLRTRRLVRYLQRRKSDDFDWFLVFDDGGFPVAENIRLLVRQFSTEEQDTPILLSDRERAGAFGALFNRESLRSLVASFNDSHSDCLAPTREKPLRTLQAMPALWRCGKGLDRYAWDAEESLRALLGCRDGDESLVNLKVRATGGVCKRALMAYMVPEPSWMTDIHKAVYG